MPTPKKEKPKTTNKTSTKNNTSETRKPVQQKKQTELSVVTAKNTIVKEVNMSELQALTAQRDELLVKIRDIEASCEGIENENNAQRVQELNMEQAQLNAQKQELSAKLSAMNSRLSAISSEIAQLSGTGIDRILVAIENQRWYFFKNKTKILMDRDTGLLWANLDYFPYNKTYSSSEIDEVINNYNFDTTGFRLPSCFELWDMICDKSFPYQEGRDWYIKGQRCWYSTYSGRIYNKCLDYSGANSGLYGDDAHLLPCSDTLVCNNDYKNNISSDNHNYTEKERLQFTLDLFLKNDLIPIFDDEEITELYKKIYYEKPKLMEQLRELQAQIESLQTVVLLSSEFDYNSLLSKYDIKSIDSSVIKYYQAVQQWTEELMEKLDYYEKEKEDVIRDFNIIGLKLGKKYENSDQLTNEENTLLRDRQRYFANRFSLGMNSVKSKILAVKHQADELEYRIDEIDNGDDAIRQLAMLEKEERASFEFIAENTAKIIRNALKKIEFFEANHQYVVWAIEAWEQWTEKYKIFKTTYREELKGSCEDDGIEEESWQKWYTEWQLVRFNIEQKFQPIIEKELRERIPTVKEDETSVVQQIISVLETYRDAVDTFYREERKGIYQNFIFQSNGDIQDRLETESKLYRLTAQFQSALQDIIFNCTKAEDRIFILNWAGDLLDIQIDDILSFISDNDLDKISETILTEFSELKKKNYEIYLADAKSYGEEQARRDKQFNSLLFKMRKGLK